MPVAIVDHRTRFRRLVPQILRQDAQRLNQRLPIRDPETTAIEIRAHPFMRIEIVAVSELNPILEMPELRTHHRGPRHCRVDMQP